MEILLNLESVTSHFADFTMLYVVCLAFYSWYHALVIIVSRGY